MPTLAFARAVGREPVDLVGCSAHCTSVNVLVDSTTASAGALDPQTRALHGVEIPWAPV